MKTRYELIDYFMQSLVYDDKNNIVDELKREYNANDSEYMQAEENITKLVPLEDVMLLFKDTSNVRRIF